MQCMYVKVNNYAKKDWTWETEWLFRIQISQALRGELMKSIVSAGCHDNPENTLNLPVEFDNLLGKSYCP